MNKDRMDKNYWIALVLSMLILIGYPYVLRKMGIWQSKPQASAPAASVDGFQPSAEKVLSAAKETELSPAAEIPAQLEKPALPELISDNNGVYDADFSTFGATVTRLRYLGEPDKPEKTSTVFYENDPAKPGIFGVRFSKEILDLSQTVFEKGPQSRGAHEFFFEKPGHYRLTKKYILDPVKPVIHLQVTLKNLAAIEQNFPIELDYGLQFEESDHNVHAAVMSDKMTDANPGKIRKKGFSVSDKLIWAGVQKKYFAILAKPEAQAISAFARVEDQTLFQTLRTEPVSIAPGQEISRGVLIYAGPQKYEYLKEFGFDPIFSQGFFGMFKIWLLLALKFLFGFVHNYGLAIILMTLIIKGLFTPLTHMSYESMKKMQAIQPKVKSIQERYKNDPSKMNKEMMELYKRNKVNPMGGCLPMLLQIPIFIAFYQVLNETIELKGADFAFWIHDLAQPDQLFALPFSLPVLGDHFNLLPLLMIGSMVWQQKLTPQPSASAEQAQVMQFMPLIFGFMFYQMPSGLVLYWLVNNLLTVVHQVFIKKMVVVLHHEDQ